MTKDEATISIESLRALLRLDASTGLMHWNRRDVSIFCAGRQSASRACNSWNANYAGKQAFKTKHGMGYLHGAIHNKKFLAHRVVWALHFGEWPSNTIDHINGIKTDNRPENLRDVSHQDNCSNQKLRGSNTSGNIGVSFDKARKKFEAYICPNGKKKTAGFFETIDEAVAAQADLAALHGFHENHGRKIA